MTDYPDIRGLHDEVTSLNDEVTPLKILPLPAGGLNADFSQAIGESWLAIAEALNVYRKPSRKE